MTVQEAIEYLNWHFTQDDGAADKNAVKAWEVLIQEKEPVEPERVLGVLPDWYCCGACGMNMLDTGDGYRPKYCPQCGRAVKWND